MAQCLHLTRLALARPSSILVIAEANLRVDIDSPRLDSRGDVLANIQHLALPPSDSASTVVSAELRYGTCRSPVDSDKNTCPRDERDLLIAAASTKPFPDTSDFETRSEPARSTSVSSDRACFLVTVCVTVTRSWSSKCDRDDAVFIAVAAVVRFLSPSSITFSTSLKFSTSRHVNSGRLTTLPITRGLILVSSRLPMLSKS
mmetsp:Transcript_14938/g.38299  ORF Transcript_14938/g.38299 Transcript_14938/m.38299 type:complete len:202 (+) Transcript_14938:232-837(+)